MCRAEGEGAGPWVSPLVRGHLPRVPRPGVHRAVVMLKWIGRIIVAVVLVVVLVSWARSFDDGPYHPLNCQRVELQYRDACYGAQVEQP